MKKVKFVLLLSAVQWVFTSICGAQQQKTTYCTIQGKVRDADGAPLAYANVYIRETMEGAMSDAKGTFCFTSRGTGEITLICSYIGYRTHEQKLNLMPGRTFELNMTLWQEEIKMRPVSVTASAFTTADEKGVTLTAMDVIRTPGAAADIFWAIKTFPGLQQVDEGAGLFVRGGDVSETAMFLDGAMINHPYKYESPTGGFFGTFSPFLLKGTFFSSGGFSAQYGNALSGALAMESQDLPDRRRTGFGLGLAAESMYLAVPVVDGKFGFSVSGNRSNAKMLFELNNSRKNFSQYPFSFDVNVNAVYKINSQNTIKCFVFREDDRIGVEIDDPDYSTDFHGNSSNQLYNMRWSGLTRGKWLMKANIAYSAYRRGMHLGIMNLDIVDRLYQSRLTGERDVFIGSTLRMGLECFYNETRIKGVVPEEETDLDPLAPSNRVDTRYHSFRTAQFVEWEMELPFRLRMTPGVRAERESVSERFSIDPRLSLYFPVSVNGTITAAWGHFRQFPEPRYYDPYVGNPELLSMEAVHYILGYTYMKDSRLFRIEGYYKQYSRLLLEDEEFNYVNTGHGFARGLDVFVKDARGRISGWVSYSWLRARRKWMDLPVLCSPYFDITHNLSLVLNASLSRRISVGCGFRYATGKPYTPGPGQYHEARVPDYQDLDLNFTYLCSFFDSNQTVFYIAVSNVLNRINIFDYRYSSDWLRRDPVESSFGRSVYFGVSFSM